MEAEIIPTIHRKKAKRTEWIKRFLEHGPYCHYCQCRLTIDTAVKEHLTPRCRGGADTWANIVPSCQACNEMKAFRTEAEFLRDRPRLLAQRTAARTMAFAEPLRPAMEMLDEPNLLKTVTAERNASSSWAWRNPA